MTVRERWCTGFLTGEEHGLKTCATGDGLPNPALALGARINTAGYDSGLSFDRWEISVNTNKGKEE